jgi:hypothetical protein
VCETVAKTPICTLFAAVPTFKRERPLYGFNFSPPSTPNGNHTIAEREQMRKEAREAVSDEGLDEFTPRCLLQRTITEQKSLVRSVTDMTTADWVLMASYLSPPCRKPPLIPGDWPLHTMPHLAVNMKSSKSPCVHSCRCIACAGVKAEPNSSPCLVCGSLIPYSVCMKKTNAQSPVPTMCFACRCAFE